jgi:type III pantothenate kinase
MYLSIDFGNSYSKLGLFEGSQLIKQATCRSLDEIREVMGLWNPELTIVSSVAASHEEIRHVLADFNVRQLTHQMRFPFRIGYTTPHTLGTDRIAAVAGAYYRFPGEASLVVDLGTCITYDYLTAEGDYPGGGISPGKRMRFRALHAFTAGLPLLDGTKEPVGELIGRSTHDAISSGVIHGIASEISGIIQNYREKFGDLRVLFCGGDAKFFESLIKEPIFVAPELVLEGLNRILTYNNAQI